MNTFDENNGVPIDREDHMARFKHICPICGKEFYALNRNYVYKNSKRGVYIYYCSWHCFNSRKIKTRTYSTTYKD